MSRLIQVFEHDTLYLHPNRWGDKLEQPELDALYTFNDRNKNIYFTGIRDGIKFRNYVGVIQIGGLTIEVLPKTSKQTTSTIESHKAEAGKWQKALLNMLAICKYIKVDAVSEANLTRRNHSILDLYFEIFLDEVTNLLHQGLIKKYRKSAGNLNALKGALQFGKNIHQNLIHHERFYTTHQVYDQNHLINQIILRALRILDSISTSPLLKDRLSRVVLDFPEVDEVEIQEHHFHKLTESRKAAHYAESIKIAKMIILNYSPSIKSGGENMLALLFDMNKLWEEYVFRLLQREQAKEHFQIKSQASRPFWVGEKFEKSIRPDLVISRGTETFIIDTKWKLLDSPEPDDADLKQIFSYNVYWKSYHSLLIYPGTQHTRGALYGKYIEGFSREHGCTLGFVDVLDKEGGLNLQFGGEILKMIEYPKGRTN